MITQTKNIILLLCLLTIFPAWAGVFDGLFGDGSPSEDELQGAVAHNMPSFIKLNKFTVEASQNFGNDVTPVWGTRFSATAVAITDLYNEDGSENGTVFVVLESEKGKALELFGKLESSLYQGRWIHKIAFDGNPMPNLGTPLNSYSEKVIIRGSEDEEGYYAEKKRKATEKKRVADEKRQRHEREKQPFIGEWIDQGGNSVMLHSDGSAYANINGYAHKNWKWKIDNKIFELGGYKYTVTSIKQNRINLKNHGDNETTILTREGS